MDGIENAQTFLIKTITSHAKCNQNGCKTKNSRKPSLLLECSTSSAFCKLLMMYPDVTSIQVSSTIFMHDRSRDLRIKMNRDVRYYVTKATTTTNIRFRLS